MESTTLYNYGMTWMLYSVNNGNYLTQQFTGDCLRLTITSVRRLLSSSCIDHIDHYKDHKGLCACRKSVQTYRHPHAPKFSRKRKTGMNRYAINGS
jgi:hypothetical protein